MKRKSPSLSSGRVRGFPSCLGRVASMDFNDQIALITIATWAGAALVSIIGLLISYWVIRLAVTHGLRSHHRWMQQNR